MQERGNGKEKVKAEAHFPSDIKRTRQREEIFGILYRAAEPVSAADIYNRMAGSTGGVPFAISTIYRALTVFEEKGYVTRSTPTGQDMCCYEWSRGQHKHYAVCLKCHKLIPLKSCPFEHAEIHTQEEDFTITGHKLELYGYCGACKHKPETEA